LVVFLAVAVASAATVGDINSGNNDLSWMVSVSRPWDGTNADLNGQLTDTLPCDLKATVTFKHGTFAGGTYRGWLHKGDFVFYVVDEIVPCHGEWREIIRAGRCGNPATGRYFVPKPQLPEAPPPCAPPPAPICIPPPPPLPTPPPVVNVYPKVECPTPQQCPAPVVNLSCPTPVPPAPRQPHAGAQIVHTRSAGADIGVGWGFGNRSRPTRFCKPFPNPPIVPPPVPPAPPY
ncbi:hypothetical protein KJ713_01780, partial [Patescibacteria group bacterium]|nr:hypothetical protein [Patescibacteria group bacterium]